MNSVQSRTQPILAMPIAGAIAWAVIGVAGAFVSVAWAAWILFICRHDFYLGLLIARILAKISWGRREKHEIDRLFLFTVLMAWMVSRSPFRSS